MMRALRNIFLVCMVFISWPYKLAIADKLIFATEVIRHGERTPSMDLPGFPSHDPLGFNQLTTRGVNQLINLGKKHNEKYMKKYALLQDDYSPNKIYARSTDFDRTLMSANAYLIGMYSSDGTQKPFAIHSKSVSEDELLLGYVKYYNIVANDAHNNIDLINLSLELQPKFKRLSLLFNQEITDINDFVNIVDTIYIRKQLNQELPLELSEEEIDSLHRDASKATALTFQKQEIGALTTLRLIEKFYDDLLLSINNKASKKFALYTAHDVTILGLLSAIGTAAIYNPPPSSNISFLIFDNEQGQYYVKFLFNDAELKIPECDNKTFCYVDEFESLVEKVKRLAQTLSSND